MRSFLVFLSLFAGLNAVAQEAPPVFETVVEDNVFNTSSRIVIDEKTIKDSRAPSITSLLATQANISIASSPFQANSIYIRGGDSGHVLIVIDGVPFYDASSLQRTFNINSLDIKSVRRIEVLKGSQTVLYGGQALSGVILIETIPQDLSTKTGLQGQIGSNGFKDISAVHLEQTGENRAVLMRAQGSWKDQESPVLNSSKRYSRNSSNGEAAYIFKGDIDAVLKGSFLQDDNYSANQMRSTGQMTDVDDFRQYSRQLAASLYTRFNKVAWEPRVSLSMQNSIRAFDMPVNATSSTLTDQDYGANLKTVRVDVTPMRSDLLTLNAGTSYVYEDYVFRDANVEKYNRSAEQKSIFLKADLKLHENFLLTAGGRLESWSGENSLSTYQVGMTIFENTKLEMSNGYKIPSLAQLYSNYGNPDLKTERSIQYSLTQDWNISDSQHVAVTLFSTYFSDLIIYSGSFPTGKYDNVGKADSRGAEVVYTWKPIQDGTVTATYGYQESKDTTTDTWLIKRPLVNGSLRYLQSFDLHTAGLELVGVGSRLDTRGSGQSPSRIPGYVVANLSYAYKMEHGLTPFLRLNNIGNYRYQESYTSYSESFNAIGGLEYWF